MCPVAAHRGERREENLLIHCIRRQCAALLPELKDIVIEISELEAIITRELTKIVQVDMEPSKRRQFDLASNAITYVHEQSGRLRAETDVSDDERRQPGP